MIILRKRKSLKLGMGHILGIYCYDGLMQFILDVSLNKLIIFYN
jgi:hypothetical protein